MGGRAMCRLFAGQNPSRYALEVRRMRVNGQSTSIRLENSFWSILDEIAEAEGISTPCFISKLHEEVLVQYGEPANFTSLLRCTCLTYLELGAAPRQQQAEVPWAVSA
jgi:predicted DNA-binding ribbon-helix-helix protein